jgi:hypothetical protein
VGLALLIGIVGAHGQAGSADESRGSAGTVLITGANRGLGLEFARQYSAAGWRVIGTARRPDAATDLNALEVRVMRLDVTDQESVDRLANDLGDEAIDLLINNAGIFPMAATLPEIDFDNITRTLAVNTIGPMRVTRALLPNLRRGGAKKIVNITSNLGSIAGNTDGRFYGYRESKARATRRWFHLHRHESGLGPDRHGRSQRTVAASRVDQRNAGGNRSPDAGGHGHLLDPRRQTDGLVGDHALLSRLTSAIRREERRRFET